MSAKMPDSQIFNPARRQAKRERAMRRGAESFLLRRAALDASERLLDVNRQFEAALFMGLPDFTDALQQALPAQKKPRQLIITDDWPLGDEMPGDLDLIVSGLALQSLDDVQGALKTARQALRPDGLFICSFLGGESLLGLRRACFGADQARYGGIMPRLSPMIDFRQAAGLLQSSGFAQPVVDMDSFIVNYASLKTLVQDLRDIGETNSLAAHEPRFEGKDFIARLSDAYTDRSENGKFLAKFEIVWMTGWAPHQSQQQPLKPGSAKMKLSDALKKIRD
ncbi:MAG: SAM-dependent methyltransferase [Hellea sp.]|nr:SAM-dependent methyltransferase [Hellea sp.]